MQLYQEFSLNFNAIKPIGRELVTVPPYIIDELLNKMSKKGYAVKKSFNHFMGIPQSITIAKSFDGPFARNISIQMREDFNMASKSLKIERLFE